MTDQTAMPRRPPPPPAPLVRRERPAAPAAPPAPPAPRGGPEPLRIQPAREWTPLPWPSLLPHGPPTAGDPVEAPNEGLIGRRMVWAAMMSWAFAVVVLLLVLQPTTAIPKLAGPSTVPVSGAAYGPIVAVFAVVAIVIAVGAGLWLWTAMGQDPDDPAQPGGLG